MTRGNLGSPTGGRLGLWLGAVDFHLRTSEAGDWGLREAVTDWLLALKPLVTGFQADPCGPFVTEIRWFSEGAEILVTPVDWGESVWIRAPIQPPAALMAYADRVDPPEGATL